MEQLELVPPTHRCALGTAFIAVLSALHSPLCATVFSTERRVLRSALRSVVLSTVFATALSTVTREIAATG